MVAGRTSDGPPLVSACLKGGTGTPATRKAPADVVAGKVTESSISALRVRWLDRVGGSVRRILVQAGR